MNEIDRLKEKIQQERAKNKELKKIIRQMKREILIEIDQLKEKVKDIMYLESMSYKVGE